MFTRSWRSRIWQVFGQHWCQFSGRLEISILLWDLEMWDHFCWHGLTLIPEWISNYIPYKMCHEISYSIQLQWFYRSEYPTMFVNTHCCTKRAKYAYPDVQCDILCLHIEAFSDGFSWTKIYEFWLKCHWSLFLGIHITIFQHWFR